MADALLERIKQELAAKRSKCACIGCTNMATHTYGGRPTCDFCGSPGRIQREWPVLIAPHQTGEGESK